LHLPTHFRIVAPERVSNIVSIEKCRKRVFLTPLVAAFNSRLLSSHPPHLDTYLNAVEWLESELEDLELSQSLENMLEKALRRTPSLPSSLSSEPVASSLSTRE